MTVELTQCCDRVSNFKYDEPLNQELCTHVTIFVRDKPAEHEYEVFTWIDGTDVELIYDTDALLMNHIN